MNDPTNGPAWTEDERLSALRNYNILDTPREPAFDTIVRTASRVCAVPIALVSLVEDRRQWFKAEVGLGVRETPLDAAIGKQALLQPGLLVVADASQDARFAGNPLVTGAPFIRFYAGALLETPEGLPLGTVCILDRQPRNLKESQGSVLNALAQQAMTLLELRRAVHQRDEALAAHARLEQHQSLLIRELHHRVKNTLATVQAIMDMTARSTTSINHFTQAVTSRISSLARTHLRITEDDRQAVSVRDLLCLELMSYDNAGSRVKLEGPDIPLPSEIVVPLSIALHELTTNAAKFGALSIPTGQLAVRWKLRSGHGTRSLHLEWIEHGAPLAQSPKVEGLGMTLLKRVLTSQVRAKVVTEYHSDRLRFIIDAPLGPVS